MAQLHAKPYTFAQQHTGFSHDEMKEQEAELSRLRAVSNALPDGTIVGGLIRFPVADDYAEYLVKSESPLVLQHIPFFDGYAVPAAHVRGLRREDIVRMLDREKRLAAMFAKPRPGASD